MALVGQRVTFDIEVTVDLEPDEHGYDPVVANNYMVIADTKFDIMALPGKLADLLYFKALNEHDPEGWEAYE